jgi:hypothetical protein
MNDMQTNHRWSAAVLTAAIMAWAMLLPRVAAAVDPLNPSPTCSVFDPGPCTPSYCGVFSGSPCVPYNLPPIGQDLHLTVSSQGADHGNAPEHPVNTIGELFAALRACWEPPSRDQAHHAMQISVRFSFKRTGEIIAVPRVTYVSKDADADAKEVYQRAVTAALERCSPMPLSKGMGGAIAGRPIAIRFVDDRTD